MLEGAQRDLVDHPGHDWLEVIPQPGFDQEDDRKQDPDRLKEAAQHESHSESSDFNIRFPFQRSLLRMLESQDHSQILNSGGVWDLTFVSSDCGLRVCECQIPNSPAMITYGSRVCQPQARLLSPLPSESGGRGRFAPNPRQNLQTPSIRRLHGSFRPLLGRLYAPRAPGRSSHLRELSRNRQWFG